MKGRREETKEGKEQKRNCELKTQLRAREEEKRGGGGERERKSKTARQDEEKESPSNHSNNNNTHHHNSSSSNNNNNNNSHHHQHTSNNHGNNHNNNHHHRKHKPKEEEKREEAKSSSTYAPQVKVISPFTEDSFELGPPTILYCHGEYALAPEYPYPCALNELEAVYYWVVQGGLGYRPRKVVLVGESAGGNILTALCVRLAKTEDPFLTKPDGLVMGYPGLNLALSPSPSRSLHMCDPLLGYGVLHTCCAAYVGGHDATTDCELSPAFAAQNLLADFPLTAIMCGGMDPLLDDAVDFYTQLCRAQRTLPPQSQKQHSFKVFRALPHGFWSMGLAMPETVKAIDLACEWACMMLEEGDKDRTLDF